MATYFARKSGNINATDVWATTPSGTAGAVTFASGDVLLSNSFTITVNVSVDLGATGEVRNDTTGGATAGGGFNLSSGVTLTASLIAGSTATSLCSISGTASATIVGNLTATTGNGGYAVNMASSGTLTITGSLTGGTASAAFCLNVGSGTVNVTGNVTASTGRCIWATGGTINVTGNVTGGSAVNGMGIGFNSGAGGTITGTVTGGTSATSEGMQVLLGGNVTVTGTAVGSTAAVGVLHSGTGTVTITRAKGGATAAAFAGVAGSTTGVTSVREIEYGDLGASPTSGPIRLTDASTNVAVMYRFGTTKKTLVDANASGLMPAASDVRFGVSYNGGNSTGTCYVPAASSVASGVNVGNTTGTAVITSADVQTACNAAIAAFSSGRLSNVATVASVGQALSDAITQ